MALTLIISAGLYFKTKDNLGYESLAELAYLCMGRSSVFVINSVYALACFFVILMYTVLFSDIGISLYQDYLVYNGIPIEEATSTVDTIFLSKTTYCTILYFINLPFIIKKTMKELKIASYILFVGIISVLAIFNLKLVTGISSPKHPT